jgi:hypothetical protein
MLPKMAEGQTKIFENFLFLILVKTIVFLLKVAQVETRMVT